MKTSAIKLTTQHRQWIQVEKTLELKKSGKSNFYLDKENLNDKFLLGEDQGRYIISVSDGLTSEVTKILDDKGIFFQKIGKAGGKKLIINDHEEAAIETLKKIHENWFNNYLEE